MARLLNRAYERLNKILSLAGSQAVNDIDLEQAFAVHDLTPLVQDRAVVPITFENETLANVGATATTTMDLWDPGVTLSTTFNNRTVSDWPSRGYSPDDWDLWINALFVTATFGEANFTQAQAYQASPGAHLLALTNPLDSLRSINGLSALPAAGTDFYVRPMPFYYVPGDSLIFQVENGGAGLLTVNLTVQGWLAQRGTYSRL